MTQTTSNREHECPPLIPVDVAAELIEALKHIRKIGTIRRRQAADADRLRAIVSDLVQRGVTDSDEVGDAIGREEHGTWFPIDDDCDPLQDAFAGVWESFALILGDVVHDAKGDVVRAEAKAAARF